LQFTKHFFTLITSQEEEVQASARKDLLAAIASISSAYTHYSGPYFLGSRLSSADIQLWPFVARLLVLGHYRDFSVPQSHEYAAFHTYVEAMRSRPAVVATTMPDAFFIDGYKGLAEGTRKLK
jgi:glutathione S-transferase